MSSQDGNTRRQPASSAAVAEMPVRAVAPGLGLVSDGDVREDTTNEEILVYGDSRMTLGVG